MFKDDVRIIIRRRILRRSTRLLAKDFDSHADGKSMLTDWISDEN
jgi:hypothetical protein